MTEIPNLINRLAHNAMISIGKRTANAKRRMNAKFDMDILIFGSKPSELSVNTTDGMSTDHLLCIGSSPILYEILEIPSRTALLLQPTRRY